MVRVNHVQWDKDRTGWMVNSDFPQFSLNGLHYAAMATIRNAHLQLAGLVPPFTAHHHLYLPFVTSTLHSDLHLLQDSLHVWSLAYWSYIVWELTAANCSDAHSEQHYITVSHRLLGTVECTTGVQSTTGVQFAHHNQSHYYGRYSCWFSCVTCCRNIATLHILSTDRITLLFHCIMDTV